MPSPIKRPASPEINFTVGSMVAPDGDQGSFTELADGDLAFKLNFPTTAGPARTIEVDDIQLLEQ